MKLLKPFSPRRHGDTEIVPRTSGGRVVCRSNSKLNLILNRILRSRRPIDGFSVSPCLRGEKLWSIGVLATLLAACASPPPVTSITPQTTFDGHVILKEAAERYVRVAMQYDPFGGHPRSTDANGKWNVVPINEWTSGFFPGTL